MNDRRRPLGIGIEQLPELPIDLLYVTLPVPRLVCLPAAMRRRLRKAQYELLLTARAVVDLAIERLEEPEQKPRPKTERIQVE